MKAYIRFKQPKHSTPKHKTKGSNSTKIRLQNLKQIEPQQKYCFPFIFSEYRKVTIVSDGIPRDVSRIDGVTLQTHYDATISEITDKLQSGEISLEDYDYVLFHVGTHDVSNKASYNDIISDFGNLIAVCKDIKSSIKIIISAIVPRLVDDEDSEPLLQKINGYLDKAMSQKMNFKFVRTYKPFKPIVGKSDRSYTRRMIGLILIQSTRGK